MWFQTVLALVTFLGTAAAFGDEAAAENKEKQEEALKESESPSSNAEPAKTEVDEGQSNQVEAPPQEHTVPPPAESVQASPGQESEESQKASGLRRIGLVSVGVGSVLTVAGLVTGIIALVKSNELHDQCPDRTCPDASDEDMKDMAEGFAIATDMLIPFGLSIAATGVILLLQEPKEKKDTAKKVTFAPVVAPQGSGFVVEGRF